MKPLAVTDHDPRLRVFSRMTDAELRDPKQLIGLARAADDPKAMQGIFIAESRNVIERAMSAGLKPFAVVAEQRWEADAHEIARKTKATLFVGSHEEVAGVTGLERMRGPLAAFYRPQPPALEDLLRDARRVAVLEDVTNFTNIGAIFRAAAALGIDAVLVTPGCHDPLYRRAARVSMGAVFQVPWTYTGTSRDWTADALPVLKRLGFTTAALALDEDSVRLQDPRISHADRLVLVLGTEGDGLARRTVAQCDLTVRIPMAHDVDSLNVAAAGAVAFWETCGRFL